VISSVWVYYLKFCTFFIEMFCMSDLGFTMVSRCMMEFSGLVAGSSDDRVCEGYFCRKLVITR
jgi:hypothetical protein